MKIPKMLNLDSDIIKKLEKEANMSLLVNELLSKHYQQHITAEELEIQKAEMENNIKLEQTKIKQIKIKLIEKSKQDKFKGVRFT